MRLTTRTKFTFYCVPAIIIFYFPQVFLFQTVPCDPTAQYIGDAADNAPYVARLRYILGCGVVVVDGEGLVFFNPPVALMVICSASGMRWI